jgi:hypothetical protein
MGDKGPPKHVKPIAQVPDVENVLDLVFAVTREILLEGREQGALTQNQVWLVAVRTYAIYLLNLR